jgi:hypothetical protein
LIRNNILEDGYTERKHTVKHDESRKISGKDADAGALMFLRTPISGGTIPILFINPPQHETSCCVELN